MKAIAKAQDALRTHARRDRDQPLQVRTRSRLNALTGRRSETGRSSTRGLLDISVPVGERVDAKDALSLLSAELLTSGVRTSRRRNGSSRTARTDRRTKSRTVGPSLSRGPVGRQCRSEPLDPDALDA